MASLPPERYQVVRDGGEVITGSNDKIVALRRCDACVDANPARPNVVVIDTKTGQRVDYNRE